jgi:non-ribosomal peptide synthetase component F
MDTNTSLELAPQLSFLVGECQTPLWKITLTELLQQQVQLNPSRECIVFPEYSYRATYSHLYETTIQVAKGLRTIGIGRGDRIGILAGNMPAYVELFFAASHVGAAYVVLNTNYTPKELQLALKHSGMLSRTGLTTFRVQGCVCGDINWKDADERDSTNIEQQHARVGID